MGASEFWQNTRYDRRQLTRFVQRKREAVCTRTRGKDSVLARTEGVSGWRHAVTALTKEWVMDEALVEGVARVSAPPVVTGGRRVDRAAD